MTEIDLEMMRKQDIWLWNRKDEQTPIGKAVRKEIQRRKMVGYTDGTAINRGFNADGTPKANPFAK